MCADVGFVLFETVRVPGRTSGTPPQGVCACGRLRFLPSPEGGQVSTKGLWWSGQDRPTTCATRYLLQISCSPPESRSSKRS